jgi:acetyltransferase-like isoleucine patch superfamily enzyme
MSRLLDRLRAALRSFLGLNELATLPQEESMRRTGEHLLRTHRIFGDSARVTLGRDVILNDALLNTSSGKVILEDFAFCGHGVCLLTGHHDYLRKGYQRQAGVPQEGRDIVVGSGAWLGSNVTVLGPCRIGAHAVVSAGSVVTGEVEPGWIYAGVPARPVKRIEFADDTAASRTESAHE